ncbi:DUF1553 domain-containing protein [Paludisphaera rhizosphaerae]|uniref:DUF1553 domain-containing protein n=1 Tax=Paludisphaera rhizosphaerae TaxID=2711216 RepID=UPI0013ED09B4|nr:DUF1553 domain-containing protein [Paludisphaera rhizosphaerae]
MVRSPRSPALILLLVGLVRVSGVEAASDPIDYTGQVKPILKARCYSCHGSLKREARLRLDTGEAIRRGGDGGPAVEPGHAGESQLIDRVVEADPAQRMPPEGAPLTPDQIEILRAWVDQGAGSPNDERPEVDPKKHWAFLPPVRPSVPSIPNASSVRNPIDGFLAKDQERRGVTPIGPAEPHVLLRRLYLDLTGLPPTRAQLQEYLSDPSQERYERVVDRLLASPQYGERWARHWMDVWRYSDWYGRRAVPDVLNSYAMIWRWRDWIVGSLNEDKGYDQMVVEMLAADEVAPTRPADLAATGFLVRNFYRWNYNSWMKDTVEHTGKAFLALTFNCAHCHDHKYDPIRQEDYFALRAVFEPMELRHDRLPGEPDPGPYPKYDYGKAYPPIKSGMVRVFDEKLDAQTFLYTRGESRNIVPNRPPVPPGMPSFLGGKPYQVVPVELPAQAAYPALQAFVRGEETDGLATALAKAEKNLGTVREQTGKPESWYRAAEMERDDALAQAASLRARIAADDARHGLASGDVEALSREASRAERLAAKTRAETALAKAELAVAEAKPPAEQEKAKKLREKALKSLETARVEAEKESADYTPIGPSYPKRSTGRRTALARWIVDRGNPLAARVAVNHIWRWHFGTPLVATTSDFGRNGTAPTHPELLDWLAVELMEPSSPGTPPWSMKALHRLIVTSAAYRSASHSKDPDSRNLAGDPENHSLWRFPTSRLEAEEVRDAVLQAAGGLDTAMGGPDIDLAQGMTSRRRTLYFTHHAEARMTFLELFDAPDACDAYRRTTSVAPQQALALVNNKLLLDLSRELADRLWAESATRGEPERGQAFVAAAFEQLLTRPPSSRELELSATFLDRQTTLLRAEHPSTEAGAAEDAASRARRDLIHALFSHNDFITVH